MKSINAEQLFRRNILDAKPYSSARSEYTASNGVFLDANENTTVTSKENRYPDPLQTELKIKIADWRNIDVENVFIGNGSDEPIDLLVRATCNPGLDNILICPPTYGIYEVAAQINDVAVKRVLLQADFQLDVAAVLAAIDGNTKLIFICSPNNPTGNLLRKEDVVSLLNEFQGLVIVDEAYIDFATEQSWLTALSEYQNLVVLQTFSKAWALAAARVGMAFADQSVIGILNKIKPPYNVSQRSQEAAVAVFTKKAEVRTAVAEILKERAELANELQQFGFVRRVFPSDANFILVQVDDALQLYEFLLAKNIIIRNRSQQPLCENCLRITVGNAGENQILLNVLKQFQS
ncbi:histidinol-phosphate transaminase [Taibaiella soli]|uniref:Histidinol-phosphate aminotransferase n=2 Tax=Taibaiella soli TaxID=1649169 RepID=A0A2W2ANQ2_9BACT|nr:histidinol-phosphate transaminase [Taibaiella soli]